MTVYTGSDIELFVAQVAAGLQAAAPMRPVVCELGEAARSGREAPPRIVWTVPPPPANAIEEGPPDQSAAHGRVIAVETQHFVVLVHGTDYAQAQLLRHDLRRVLFPLGGRLYTFRGWKRAGDTLTGGNGFGWVGDFTLRVPVVAEFYTTITLEKGVLIPGTVSAADAAQEIPLS